jgi:hypothetical protein
MVTAMHVFEKTKEKRELHVFDFDGTLFRSPMPPPGVSEREWWSDVESLNIPKADVSKRATSVTKELRRSLSNPSAYVIVLTGRVDVPGMRERISEILQHIDAVPHRLYLRDLELPTPKFKAHMVRAILRQFPDISSVTAWNDMADNLKAMSSTADGMGVGFQARFVRGNSVVSRLPSIQEQIEAFVARRRSEDFQQALESAMRIGTVRDWKRGRVIKTARGWVPLENQPLSPGSAAQKAMKSPLAVGGGAAATTIGSINSRKSALFSPAKTLDALDAFAAIPNSDAAQRKVRKSLRKLCSDFGMLDRGGESVGSKKFGVFEKKHGVPDGLHTWDGTIVVKPKIVARAKSLMEAVSQGKQQSEWPEKAATGMHVLVHEAIHGHSPIRREQYKGRYRLLEEATTELAARKVMKDAFGVAWSDYGDVDDTDSTSDAKMGAYAEFCSAVSQGVRAALQRTGIKTPDGEAWQDFLGEAAIEMRRRPPPTDPDKYAYLNRFASSLPLTPEQLQSAGGAEKVFKEVSEAVWLSLKPAREREKLFTIYAALIEEKGLSAQQVKSGDVPEDVKKLVFGQIDATKQAEKKWADYLSGKSNAAEAVESLLAALHEAGVVLDDDTGVLPRNDIGLAVAYARVLSEFGELTPGALRDLALLQNDSMSAAEALADAVEKYQLRIVPEKTFVSDGIVF